MLARPIVVLLALLSAPASAQSIADFAGEWQDARQNVHVSQQVSGDGFHVVVTTPGDPSRIEGWLYPTRAPHVFAAEGTGNPLDGDVAMWGRLAGPNLVLYRMALDSEGKIQLDRFDRKVAADGMSFRLERRRGPDQTVLDGRLESVP